MREWRIQIATDLAARLDLSALSIPLPLADLYDLVEWDPAEG